MSFEAMQKVSLMGGHNPGVNRHQFYIQAEYAEDGNIEMVNGPAADTISGAISEFGKLIESLVHCHNDLVRHHLEHGTPNESDFEDIKDRVTGMIERARNGGLA